MWWVLKMNHFEREVSWYIEQNGPSTSAQIHYALRHRYYIGTVKEVSNRIRVSSYFRKVDKVTLVGASTRYKVVLWEVKKDGRNNERNE